MVRWISMPGCLLAAALLASPSWAASRVELTKASFMEIDEHVLGAQGRPNEQARWRGLKSYVQGDYVDAIDQFKRAAFNADKFSQHYLSLIYWHGIGVSRDPVEAYIWSDLAAERGSHKLLAVREKMWSKLTPGEQAQVQDRGMEFYSTYGDDVAKPRVENVMRQFARDMTGSRVGYRNQQLAVTGRPINGLLSTQKGSNASAYAFSEHSGPDELYGKQGGLAWLESYWRGQDVLLEGGRVDVGAPTTARNGKK